MRHEDEAFEAAGAQVVLVGLSPPVPTETFREESGLDFPIICDPDRKLFRAYGLSRMSPLSLLSPRLAFKGLSAMSQGHMMGLPAGDVRQLGGVFVIDTDGRIRFRHASRDPSDNPDIAVLREALAEIE